jgi:hypothetical protein
MTVNPTEKQNKAKSSSELLSRKAGALSVLSYSPKCTNKQETYL